jgi:hypothetical protein
MAVRGGFNVMTYVRNTANKEKAVDTELVAESTLVIATTSPDISHNIGASGRRISETCCAATG